MHDSLVYLLKTVGGRIPSIGFLAPAMVRLVAAVQKKMVMSLLPVLMTSVLLFRHLPALPPLPVRTFQRSVSAALLSLEGLRHRAFNSQDAVLACDPSDQRDIDNWLSAR